MIEATIKIAVPPENKKELLQTFRASLNPIRQEQGCLSCDCYVDIEAENNLFFREEWRTREDLETHLRSGLFSVLIGAMSLVESAPEIKFNTIATTAGIEVIETIRSSSTGNRRGNFQTVHSLGPSAPPTPRRKKPC
ncbi:MAG: putative quinol monooxygenase [Desulfuromonadales bacterium]|nr:putative quinol monooxygenase [Desulfuromonadales bacterium]MDW7758191.1 putative quinol monooxygenase [Desulfuromonadales bacterium]